VVRSEASVWAVALRKLPLRSRGLGGPSCTTLYGMIILDTNQLQAAGPPDGPIIALLQALHREAGHQPCLPELVLAEYMAKHGHIARQAFTEYKNTAVRLRKLIRVGVPFQENIGASIEAMLSHHRHALEEVFRILPTPDEAWKEALLREAYRKLPARTTFDRPGSGARDAAIWLTALATCRESEQETYFISADEGAFGGKGGLHPELREEQIDFLGDRRDEFHYHYDVTGLFDAFGSKFTSAPDCNAIGSAQVARDAITDTLNESASLFFQLWSAMSPFFQNESNHKVQALSILNGKQASAYRIGKTIWASAQPTWQVAMTFLVSSQNANFRNARQEMHFKSTATLLMKLEGDGNIIAAQVLGQSPAFEIQTGDLIR
jgi:hypothetical protein